MIQYTLKCADGHQSESWFKSADAYEALVRAGHLTCPVCGGTDVAKALMAPRLSHKAEESAAPKPVLANPTTEMERALRALRAEVEQNSDYVGDSFASEARAMHLGEKPERSIYGEARLDQARELLAEGVPLMPLPFRPKQKLT